MTETVCFSSGGARGYAYIGVLKALREANLSIKHVMGSSIGALACLLYVLEFTTIEQKTLAYNILLSDLIEINLDCLALDDGFRIGRYVRAVLIEKGFDERTTFQQLFEKKPIKLTVVATDVIQGSRVDFNHETSPEMPVSIAIRASMSVPLLFAPVHYKNLMLVDGAVSCFLPEHDNALMFSVDTNMPQPLKEAPSHYQDYIPRLLEMFFYQTFRVPPGTCIIKSACEYENHTNMIKTLMRRGYKQAKAFIEDRLQQSARDDKTS